MWLSLVAESSGFDQLSLHPLATAGLPVCYGMLDQCLVNWMRKDIDVPDVRTHSLRTRTGSQSPMHLQDRITAHVLGNHVSG